MKFEYRITKHLDQDFPDLTLYCTEGGTCSLSSVSEKQLRSFEDTLQYNGLMASLTMDKLG